MAARFQSKQDWGFMPTINLTCDFMAPAKLGAWVEGRADLARVTKSMIFVQGMATADGEPCLRANGIFKRFPPNDHGFSLDRLCADS